MIAVFDKVTKKYPTGEGIQEVSFEVPEGQVIGLLGLNGSGKTTTMKLLSGLLSATSGTVQVLGNPARVWPKQVAYLGDRGGFPNWMAPADMARFMKTFFQDFQPDVFNRIKGELGIPEKPLNDMSKGQQQKTKLAATMARRTRLYLLDEPLSGIDLIARMAILKSLIGAWDSRSSVILSTHEIKDVEPYLHRALFLVGGSLKADDIVPKLPLTGESVVDRFLALHGGQS